jgi:hypothetical protein
MVERVARGRIMVPAAAALTVMAAGMVKPEQANAAGPETTLEIRVQVVEPCRIRLAPSGGLAHSCGGGGPLSQTPVAVQLSGLVERFDATVQERLAQTERPPMLAIGIVPARPIEFTTPYVVSIDAPSARFTAANQRASDVAERIGQRVRHITVAY